MDDYTNPWTYKGIEFTSDSIEDYTGFVYVITNVNTDRKYIGKKIFTTTTRVKQKHKTRRKIKRKESNWKDYYGSSPSLLKDIEQYGKDNFKREIIHLCINKSQMAYFEAKEQFMRGCLESSQWYNEHIMCRVRKDNLKLT